MALQPYQNKLNLPFVIKTCQKINMQQKFSVNELTTIEEMKDSLPILQELYPEMDENQYLSLLKETVPHNYKQLIVKDENEIVGISGFWIATKIWCGKYLELDNVVVRGKYRSKGVGKIMTDYLYRKAIEHDCTMLGLDVYTDNYKGIKFYMNEGFIARGFHMIKILKGKF